MGKKNWKGGSIGWVKLQLLPAAGNQQRAAVPSVGVTKKFFNPTKC
jgi:hypothetical protein